MHYSLEGIASRTAGRRPICQSLDAMPPSE